MEEKERGREESFSVEEAVDDDSEVDDEATEEAVEVDDEEDKRGVEEKGCASRLRSEGAALGRRTRGEDCGCCAGPTDDALLSLGILEGENEETFFAGCAPFNFSLGIFEGEEERDEERSVAGVAITCAFGVAPIDSADIVGGGIEDDDNDVGDAGDTT